MKITGKVTWDIETGAVLELKQEEYSGLWNCVSERRLPTVKARLSLPCNNRLSTPGWPSCRGSTLHSANNCRAIRVQSRSNGLGADGVPHSDVGISTVY